MVNFIVSVYSSINSVISYSVISYSVHGFECLHFTYNLRDSSLKIIFELADLTPTRVWKLEISVFYSNQNAVFYKRQYKNCVFRGQTFVCMIFGQNVQTLNVWTLRKNNDEYLNVGTGVFKEGYADSNKNRALWL